jgi:hypothetical protein
MIRVRQLGLWWRWWSKPFTALTELVHSVASGVHNLSFLMLTYEQSRFCRCLSGVCGSSSSHSRNACSWLIVENQLQVIHGYTDTNAPIINDFADVYHDPMAISTLQSFVCCQLCLRTSLDLCEWIFCSMMGAQSLVIWIVYVTLLRFSRRRLCSFERDTTTQGVVARGNFAFSLGTICVIDRTLSNR